MMFANEGYLPSQTHMFSSFPDSAVDLNDDEDDDPINLQTNQNPSYAYNTSSTTPSTAETTDDSTVESVRFWQVEFYQKYFSIDTNDVIDRLTASIHPRPDKSHFIANIRMNPDLYGPIWICLTLIITVGISGNLSKYFYLSDTNFQLDLSRITLSATLICFYCGLMPTFLYVFFRWRFRREEYFFLELICIYGYSFTIFIPISILWIIQIHWLQWIFTLMASFVSGSVLIVIFWPKIHTDPKSINTLVIFFSLLLHLLMSICLMLVFYRI